MQAQADTDQRATDSHQSYPYRLPPGVTKSDLPPLGEPGELLEAE